MVKNTIDEILCAVSEEAEQIQTANTSLNDFADEIEQIEQVVTPDVVGKSVAEAEKLLKENGLELVLESEVEDTEALIKEQVPSAGIVVKKGSKVFSK